MDDHGCILVVDDDDGVRHFLRRLLEREKWKVIEAENGKHALQLFKSHPPAIVLLDVEMPDLSGFEVAKRMKRSPTFSGKIAMLSAHKKVQEQVAGLSSGAIDYITKPFHPQVLVEKIRIWLKEWNKESGKMEEPSIVKGDFRLSTICRTLYFKEEKLSQLTEIEYKLFQLLLEKSPHPLSKQELWEALWRDKTLDTQIVPINVYRLRKKLKFARSCLQNIRGRGFRVVTVL